MAARVVGYLEYGNALDNFDRLVSQCSEEELAAVDEIVAERDEFTLFSNLSRQLPANSASTAVDGLRPAENPDARRGIAWLMALARVEFGAIVSGFTDHPDPYQFVRPDNVDFKECLELLVDGVLKHHAELQGNRQFKKLTRFPGPIKPTLAFSRRVRIVQEMLQAAMRHGPSYYSPGEAAQLASYYDDLDESQSILLARIRQFLAAQVDQSIRTTDTEFVNACGRMLRAESRERQAGTAVTRRIGPSSSSGR